MVTLLMFISAVLVEILAENPVALTVHNSPPPPAVGKINVP